ncbi:MAG: Tn3 family transposase, partial [Singulisphaera sp.]|nr:Tn3 family transposase [Singulisphaera sp.]
MTPFRPSKTVHYKHIDSLFTDVIDWPLIETHLPDMLRVVLSIRAGRISAATL